MTGEAQRRYLTLVGIVSVVAAAGYLGYVLYPRFDLPATAGAGLLGLAAAAGVAGFFSPCSFPLLAALLARSSDESRPGPSQRRAALVTGGWIGLGAAGFLLALGLVIAAGGAGLARSITFDSLTGRVIRGVVGGGLVILGLIQSGAITANWRRFESAIHRHLRQQARLRRRHPAAGHILFGFGYLAAGFG